MAGQETIRLTPGAIALDQLRRILRDGAGVALADEARAQVETGHQAVLKIVEEGRTVYGVNTGFGKLASVIVPKDQLAELQRNLVMSHSVGMGPLLEDGIVRLVLTLKAASLARGYSGVSWAVVETLLAFLERDLLPCIPSKGSVGASGDLAPLAHLAAVLIGEGEAKFGGKTMPGAAALKNAGLKPLVLGPKEGLALLNGTQVSTALALAGLFEAEDLLNAGLLAGALSLDAAMGSTVPFDARIQEVRGQPGQADVAKVYRELLEGSAIRDSHLDCDRVQDPYSLRCQPQVMGACLDHIRFAADVFAREANAVSDNPLVFPADGDVLPGGNFHAEPVAMAADVLALAIAEIGALAERRVALLVDTNFSGLPPFLIEEGGINSGFMMAHVTAAALASENKSLAHPASVDSLPTSANQEDHVSMATYAARRLSDMAENTGGIVGIELLAAAQAIEFHAPTTSSETMMALLAEIRARVPRLEQDRFMTPDMAAISALVASGDLNRFVPGGLVPSLPA
jgi:histidine ammonia-lyase